MDRELTFFALWQAPSGVLYVASGGLYVRPGPSVLYRSSDGGLTWLPVVPPHRWPYPRFFGAFGTADALYLAGNDGKICRFSEAGFALQDGGVSTSLFAIAGAGSVLVAAGEAGVLLRSADAGLTWQRLPSGVTSVFREVHADAQGRFYALATDGVLLRSLDRGCSWAQTTSVPADLWLLWAAEDGVLYAESHRGAIYRSDDRAETWQLEHQRDSFPSESLCGTPSGAIFSMGNPRLIRDRSGGWRSSHSGPWSHRISAVAELAGGERYLLGRGGEIFSKGGDAPQGPESVYEDAGWVRRTCGVYCGVNDLRGDNAGRLYLAGRYGVLLCSDDGGQTLRCLPTGAEGTHGTERSLDALFIGASGQIYACGTEIVLMSRDGGTHFTRCDTGKHRPPGGAVWVSAAEAIYLAGHGMLSSSDGGVSWKVLPCGTRKSLLGIWGDEEGTVYVVGDKGIFLSTRDGGQTFAKQELGNTATLARVWGHGGRLYVSARWSKKGAPRSALLRSLDGGASWEELALPLSVKISTLCGDGRGYLYLIDERYDREELPGQQFLSLLLCSRDGGDTWGELSCAGGRFECIWASRAGVVYAVDREAQIVSWPSP